MSCVQWNGIFRDPYRVTCGVRQGGLLSPVLFNIYVDKLLHLLSTSHYGCHVRSRFFGCIMSADDLILLSPSLCGLQCTCMLDICSDYAMDHSLVLMPIKQFVLLLVNLSSLYVIC